jgi:hypothetical protein
MRLTLAPSLEETESDLEVKMVHRSCTTMGKRIEEGIREPKGLKRGFKMAQLTGSRSLQVKRWLRKLEIHRRCSLTTSPWTKEAGGAKPRRRILVVLRLEIKAHDPWEEARTRKIRTKPIDSRGVIRLSCGGYGLGNLGRRQRGWSSREP